MKQNSNPNINSKKNIDKLGFLRKLILITFAITLVASFAFGETIAKYVFSEKTQLKEDGSGKDIEFTMNTVYVVKTAEDLFAAINQGYTYIQLDKEIENPLIITQKAENLENDLILDLNGIEIQRNGHDPILNVNDGVKLTVIDSSEEQTGGLYNPVGSVFNINGGSLSVVTGFFESGPRYSEYYTYNNEILDGSAESLTKRTIVESEARDVKFYKKDSNGTFSSSETKKAPIIKSYPTVTGDIKYNHGNLYFDQSVIKDDFTIKADTYCYYQTSEKSAIEVDNLASADWYYTYYVDESYDYNGTTQNSENTLIEVIIYGYENVILGASNMNDPKDYYAAIQMSRGTLDVQNGSFFQYFGVDKTACVNAQGGTINVTKGEFSSRVPNATEYVANKVNQKESDKKAFDKDYFNNFGWCNTNQNTDFKAKKGESYCILNGGSATVKIGTGEFYSSNNNIISMKGGNLSILGGTFTKKLTNGLVNDNDKKVYLSAINMVEGILTIESSDINVNGGNTYGIYSKVTGNDSFNIKDTDFTIDGENCIGVYSSGGTVNITASKTNNVSITGSNNKGIVVEGGGTVVSENYNYKLVGENSYGIYSKSGSIYINKGNITLESDDNCYGIYAASNEEIDIEMNDSTIAVGCSISDNGPLFNAATKTGEVYSSIGIFLSSNNNKSDLKLTNVNIYCNELGIVSNGGNITLSNNNNGKGIIKTNKASAIAVKNGSVTFDKGSNYTITSASTVSNNYENSYTLFVPTRNDQTISYAEYQNTDGIYVEGGSFTSEGNLTITHTGLQNKTDYDEYIYSSLVVTSYAVRVLGGNVNINKGKITAKIGGGIYAGKIGSTSGSITLGDEESQINDIYVSTKGNKVGTEYDAIGVNKANGVDLSGWKSYKSITGGHAVELAGGNITIYNGYYKAQFGNGIFVNGSSDDDGEIKIYYGQFYGYMNALDMNNKSIDLSSKTGPSAYYGLKVIGGSKVYIYDGIFDGGNGGAFVTGVTKISNNNREIKIEKNKTAYVYVYKGTFGTDGNEKTDGFNVYDDVVIVFGAHNQGDLSDKESEEISKLIVVNCINAAIAANPLLQDASKYIQSSIYVYYGTYKGTTGMYKDKKITSEETYKTYNTNTNIMYTISTKCEGEKRNIFPEYYSENTN